MFRSLELSIHSPLLPIHVLGTYCVLYISPYCLYCYHPAYPVHLDYGSIFSYDRPSLLVRNHIHLATSPSSASFFHCFVDGPNRWYHRSRFSFYLSIGHDHSEFSLVFAHPFSAFPIPSAPFLSQRPMNVGFHSLLLCISPARRPLVLIYRPSSSISHLPPGPRSLYRITSE